MKATRPIPERQSYKDLQEHLKYIRRYALVPVKVLRYFIEEIERRHGFHSATASDYGVNTRERVLMQYVAKVVL